MKARVQQKGSLNQGVDSSYYWKHGCILNRENLLGEFTPRVARKASPVVNDGGAVVGPPPLPTDRIEESGWSHSPHTKVACCFVG